MRQPTHAQHHHACLEWLTAASCRCVELGWRPACRLHRSARHRYAGGAKRSAATLAHGRVGAPAADETLSALERVRVYAASTQSAQRLYVVRELCELCTQVRGRRRWTGLGSARHQTRKTRTQVGPQETCASVVPCLEPLVRWLSRVADTALSDKRRDPEPSVRQQLAESIPQLCAWLRANVSLELYTTNVLHILLPLVRHDGLGGPGADKQQVAELTTDDNPGTRSAAVTALVDVARGMRWLWRFVAFSTGPQPSVTRTWCRTSFPSYDRWPKVFGGVAGVSSIALICFARPHRGGAPRAGGHSAALVGGNAGALFAAVFWRGVLTL